MKTRTECMKDIETLFNDVTSTIDQKIGKLCWEQDTESMTRLGELARMKDLLCTLHEDIDNIIRP